MKIEQVAISKVKSNENNPRNIDVDRLKKLVKSIKEFPEMLNIRPIVVNDEMVVLGGNQRLEACKQAGMKEIPIIKASNLTEKQQDEFILKDNVNFGTWDHEMLNANYSIDTLIDLGINVLFFKDENEQVDEKEKTFIMEEMELKFNEHHDYIVFLFDNVNDWVSTISKLDIGKMPVSLSPKIKKIGLGRVVSASKLLNLLDK